MRRCIGIPLEFRDKPGTGLFLRVQEHPCQRSTKPGKKPVILSWNPPSTRKKSWSPYLLNLKYAVCDVSSAKVTVRERQLCARLVVVFHT